MKQWLMSFLDMLNYLNVYNSVSVTWFVNIFILKLAQQKFSP